MHVYLSGGMEYADDGGKGWREEMQQWIGHELNATVFNPPLETERYLRTHHPDIDLRVLKATDPDTFRRIIGPIIERDCREVAERADLVICRWDHSAMRGAGTQGELTIARYFGKPVLLLCTIDPEDLPGWIVGCTSVISRSPDDLKEQIAAYLSP
jgi:hypothetical protein